jgi:hypothetical protein
MPTCRRVESLFCTVNIGAVWSGYWLFTQEGLQTSREALVLSSHSSPLLLAVASLLLLPLLHWPNCRLLSRARAVHDRLYREAYGCGRRGGAVDTGRLLDDVQDVQDLLQGYK